MYITDSMAVVSTINVCACVQFQENEKKRYRAETLRFELKHQHQLEELRAAADTTIRELEQLQNEKRQYFFLSITFIYTIQWFPFLYASCFPLRVTRIQFTSWKGPHWVVCVWKAQKCCFHVAFTL